MGQEKSLQLSKRADETLLGKAITNIGRILYSSSFNIYTLLIARRRSAVVRAFNNYIHISEYKDEKKREEISEKYKQCYANYIAMLDKYVTENIYSKMQKRAATIEEERIMSKYYAVNKFKDTDEVEHRVRLETLCLNIDWENVQSSRSDSYVEKFKAFFVYNLEELYKAQMRHNAILLANAKKGDRDQYEAIYSIIETYIKEALPVLPERESFNGIIKDYKKYVAALDSYEKKDFLELRKRLTLLGFAKNLFEYSFPAIAQEQCYLEIIEIARTILSNYYTDADKYASYEVLLDAIEEYIENVLEYKSYWISEVEKKEFKKLEVKWQELKKLARIDYDCYLRKREVLFIKYDLDAMKRMGLNLAEVKDYYRERLLIRHALRIIKNHAHLTKGYFFKLNNSSTSHARAFVKSMIFECKEALQKEHDKSLKNNIEDSFVTVDYAGLSLQLQEMIKESRQTLSSFDLAHASLGEMIEECEQKLDCISNVKQCLKEMVAESLEETSIVKAASKALFEMRREAYSCVGQMLYTKSLLSDMIEESKEDTSIIKEATLSLCKMLEESEAPLAITYEAQRALDCMVKECEFSISKLHCHDSLKDMIAECEDAIDSSLEAKKALCMMTCESELEAKYYRAYVALKQMKLECAEDLSVTKNAQKALDFMLTECRNATNITTSIRETVKDIIKECEEDTSVAKQAKFLLSDMVYESVVDTDVTKEAKAYLRSMISECKAVVKVDYLENIINDVQNLVNTQYEEYNVKSREMAKVAEEEPESNFNLMDLIFSSTKNLKKKRKAKI